MTRSNIPHAVAAVATTLAIFSSVVGLAEDDRKALAAARVVPTQIAAVADSPPN